MVHKPLSHQLFHFVLTDWAVEIIISPFHQCQDWNPSSGFLNNTQTITLCSTYSCFGRTHTHTHTGICMHFALDTIQMCICPQYTFVGSFRKSSYNLLGKREIYLGILAKWLSSVSLSVHTRMHTHTHTQCLAHAYLCLYVNHHPYLTSPVSMAQQSWASACRTHCFRADGRTQATCHSGLSAWKALMNSERLS